MKMKRILFTAVFGLSVVLSAATARVDFAGIKGTRLAALKVFGNAESYQAAWQGDKRDERLVLEMKVGQNWETQKFVFVPKNDGIVQISIMPNKKALFAFDGFEVEGAVSKLKNPGFEESDSKITGWYQPAGTEIRSDGAFEGKNYVFLSKQSKSNVAQWIKVKRGVPVTIKFAAKLIPE